MSHPTPTTSTRHTTAAPSTPDQPPSWAPAAPTIALLTALGVLMVGQMYTVLALLHPMATALGTTPEQVTWMATAFGFAYAAGFLLAGPLSDRYGSRAVITAGLVAATVATLAVSAAPTSPRPLPCAACRDSPPRPSHRPRSPTPSTTSRHSAAEPP